jgi:hypothetical protein
VPTQQVANPLGGEPLRVGGGSAPESSTCDRPFDAPGFSLSATTEEICMSEVVVTDRSPHAPPPQGVERIERVLSGDAPKSVIELAADGPARNVSRCSGQMGERIVWSQSFKGCTANKGIILPTTKLFGMARDDHSVDHGRPAGGAPDQAAFLRWQFQAGGAAAAPASLTGAKTPRSATPAAEPAPSSAADDTVGGKYKADVRKCMRGEPVDGGSMVGGGTCKSLRRAAQSGDTSGLPKGAADMFRQIRSEGGA